MRPRASGASLWYSHLRRTARYPYITSLIEMALFVGIKQLLGRVSAARVTGTATLQPGHSGIPNNCKAMLIISGAD